MKRQTFLVIGAALALGMTQAKAAEGDVSVGETMYGESCAQCHGGSGQGMASFPSIAGRDADYIIKRLKQYRAGERVGANSSLMAPAAADLSDQDIANLAAFISEDFQ